MKKVHRHADLIREWLDLGCPPVESKSNDEWVRCTDNPWWHEGYEYRLAPPPKQKRIVKLEAWITPLGILAHIEQESEWPTYKYRRVPSLDLAYEVES